MKRLYDLLKSAKKHELLILIAVICILFILYLGGSKTDQSSGSTEERLQGMLSRIEGAGKVYVLLAESEESGYTGAVITCSGADNMRVVLELQRAVKAFTGLESDQIEVIKSG